MLRKMPADAPPRSIRAHAGCAVSQRIRKKIEEGFGPPRLMAVV
jgi:hypothetical protein